MLVFSEQKEGIRYGFGDGYLVLEYLMIRILVDIYRIFVDVVNGERGFKVYVGVGMQKDFWMRRCWRERLGKMI